MYRYTYIHMCVCKSYDKWATAVHAAVGKALGISKGNL